MQKYCVVEKRLLEHHAGAKARSDVADILMSEGWKPVCVHQIQKRENVGYLERIKMCFYVEQDWRKISKTIEKDACLLIQYPLDMYPKVAMLSLKYIEKMKNRGVKIGILIHDLESLRNDDPKEKEWYQQAERRFLDTADFIIAHNQKMIKYLNSVNLKAPKYSLELFDYLLDEAVLAHAETSEDTATVAVAGNLSEQKAGYIYQSKDLDFSFALYGPYAEKELLGKNMEYYGSFPPEELPGKLKAKFGLVWDGKSPDECEGGFGKYMRYNNPHKTSLYLASNLPVIVWKDAAVAAFVEKHNVGFGVQSLSEIPEKIEKLTEESYHLMKENAKNTGKALRQGEMLKRVLKTIKEIQE